MRIGGKMSRQHYEHLARTLGRAVAVEALDNDNAGAGAAYRVALALADSLADTNPAYDGGRFLDRVASTAILSAQAHTEGPIVEGRGIGAILGSALAQRNASRYARG